MKFCDNCGNELSENQKFCPNCGKNLSGKVAKKEETTDPYKLKCPHCSSGNVQVQIVSQNKNTGCLMVFVYIFLALTIVGIPIMILILLLKGKKSVNRKYYVCQNCGHTFNALSNSFSKTSDSFNQMPKRKQAGLIVAIVFGILIFCAAIAVITVENENSNYLSKEEYSELNVQTLHSDYLNNEVSAKEKYEDKYFYVTGKVHKVEQFLNDNYLVLMYRYNKDNSKQIEINTYFKDAEKIKSVNKDDNVTVYCKFKHRSIDNYMGVTTSYSLDYCQFIEE